MMAILEKLSYFNWNNNKWCCKIDDNTFIGSGSIVHQNVQIGKNCIIGMVK